MINLTEQQVLRVIELAERTLDGPSFPSVSATAMRPADGMPTTILPGERWSPRSRR
jgi:hypothetical protein